MAHLPRDVFRRILERSSAGEPVVVVPRDGKPARVFGLREYLEAKRRILKVRPWRSRKRAPADPLGAHEGKVLGPLRRNAIYDP